MWERVYMCLCVWSESAFIRAHMCVLAWHEVSKTETMALHCLAHSVGKANRINMKVCVSKCSRQKDRLF